ncbi:MAG: tetratricopeptide repeat protein [Desulfobacterales bacterium]|jgi:cytochrome c-type biogenesis protein CcmH/NrfG|nr:tetratricopeptide repeat protein [Desulfobacterales bacterium]
MKDKTLQTQIGVKKETTLLFVFIALGIGFIGGVVFSAFKLDSTTNLMGVIPADPHDHAADSHIAALEETVAKEPNNAAAWIELGNLFFDAQQVEKAIHAYETAVKIQPENADVWTDLGVMYRRKGDAKQALAAFNKAQALDPRHEISLFNAGVVLMHDLHQPQEAKAVWEKLIQVNPAAKTPSGQSVRELVEKIK